MGAGSEELGECCDRAYPLECAPQHDIDPFSELVAFRFFEVDLDHGGLRSAVNSDVAPVNTVCWIACFFRAW